MEDELSRVRELADGIAYAVELREMYADMLGDFRLGEQFAELEEHLLNPNLCDHGDLGPGGCSVDRLRSMAEEIRDYRVAITGVNHG